MIRLIIAAVIVLGAQWLFFGELITLNDNVYMTIIADFLCIIVLAGCMCGPSQVTGDIMDADIRMNKK